MDTHVWMCDRVLFEERENGEFGVYVANLSRGCSDSLQSLGKSGSKLMEIKKRTLEQYFPRAL